MRNATIRAALRLILAHLESQLNPLKDARTKWCDEVDEQGNQKLNSNNQPRSYDDYYEWENRRINELTQLVNLVCAVLEDMRPFVEHSDANYWNKHFKNNPR